MCTFAECWGTFRFGADFGTRARFGITKEAIKNKTISFFFVLFHNFPICYEAKNHGFLERRRTFCYTKRVPTTIDTSWSVLKLCEKVVFELPPSPSTDSDGFFLVPKVRTFEICFSSGVLFCWFFQFCPCFSALHSAPHKSLLGAFFSKLIFM